MASAGALATIGREPDCGGAEGGGGGALDTGASPLAVGCGRREVSDAVTHEGEESEAGAAGADERGGGGGAERATGALGVWARGWMALVGGAGGRVGGAGGAEGRAGAAEVAAALAFGSG